MEKIHRSKAAAKKLWSLIRLAFLLFKKGLISQRNLILHLNTAFKRIRFSARYHHHSAALRRRHGDYEFSCSNSPNPVFSHVASSLHKHRAHLFPCIRSPLVLDQYESSSSLVHEVDEKNAVVLLPCRAPEFDFGPGLSDSLSEEEVVDGGDPRVDDEAEEFIRRFYEQLRSQSTAQLLQY